MADKQFARSGPAEFDVLADDDPLAELARIVGYDARPAVQQLQELQRHQEAVRQDPAFDLEEELLREFDTYDAPRAASVQPDNGPVEHVASVAQEVQQTEPALEFELSELAVPESARVEEVLALEPAYQPAEFVEPWAEAIVPSGQIDHAPAEVVAFPETPSAPIADPVAYDFVSEEAEPAFDLEHELELSLGDVDLSPAAEFAPVEQHVAAPEEWHAPVEAISFDVSDFNRETATEQASLAVEPTFEVAPAAEGGNAYALDNAYAYEPVVIEPAAPVAAEPTTDNAVDELLADIERFPVPAATGLVAAAVHTHPAVHARAEPVATGAALVKKSPYPFTPTFSRATPVASASGVGQQRAFAGPIVSSIPAAAAAAVPVAAPVVPEAVVEPARPIVEPENEPSFDIENFEMELSDVALEMELPEFDASEDVATAFQQPVFAAVEPAPLQREEPFVAPPIAAAPIEIEEAPVESALPFDPSMIAEADTGVAPIADMEVPQLPVIETEKPVAYPADYDLDIDAEMAQLFGTPAPSARETQARPVDVREPARTAPAAKPAASFGAAPMDDFDEFEKAMEEDFRRSMAERQTTPRESERVQPMSGQAEEGVYKEYGSGRRSQRAMLLAASVAGVIILGGAGVYAWMGGSDAASSGEGPKIILADKSPVKVVPEEKGGKTVPNQDKAVYDRVAGAQGTGPRQEALVSSTEEPMDVVQRTLTPENLPNDSSDEADALGVTSPNADEESARLLPDDGTAAPADQEEDKAPAVAPRKVRTMIVKPDGTLVAREEPVAEPAAEVAGNAQPVPATASGQVAASGAEGQATAAGAGSELRAAGQAPAGADQVALAAASNATVNSGDQAPLPQTRPAEQAANVAAAATAARPAETQAAASAAVETQQVSTASVPAGTYFIQVASLPSEAEAQKSYNSLSNKFGSVIGGRGVDIRKAEIAGKGTYYRVRIPAGSREEANALCSRYKGAGGSCLVTK
ncbi:SPOR domain-containing protein [Ensifer sp. HO-A22]|uniref:SPOR domain-containing protein n=1 Tax=Ensifer oleiphilus TaxID=2742698 RepID=A0A7Y6Q8X9_9HYPH|nr:SPOR domain-containing protein [Ensifer oleiphilus]NVD41248.1 SPOR domain-containing protein [Ensifer oleiphilus]